MSKKYLVSLGTVLALILSTGISMADVQSPLYTDDIGRSHFLGRGGYSTVRQVQMDATQADVVNQTANEFAQQQENSKNITTTERKITDVIKERETVPTTARSKATFSAQDRQMDASAPYGYGMTNIRPTGVNESKTIYTDDLGRLHFFRKANQIQD